MTESQPQPEPGDALFVGNAPPNTSWHVIQGQIQAIQAARTMRRFVLDRASDVTGISGTGIILFGIEWKPGGPVDAYWLGTETTGQYPSMTVFEKTHCYNNNAKVVYLD